jgi:ArsR family transcriptional regulator, arsenate/arsenite/antimonite-responsive transcriptional repressor
VNAKAAVAALGALAQQSRLAIFRTLVQAGPSGLSAGDIGKRTRIAPSALSFHLKELTHAKLAQSRHEGRFIFYAADFGSMNALLSFLTENCCGGEDCGACAPSAAKGSK